MSYHVKIKRHLLARELDELNEPTIIDTKIAQTLYTLRTLLDKKDTSEVLSDDASDYAIEKYDDLEEIIEYFTPQPLTTDDTIHVYEYDSSLTYNYSAIFAEIGMPFRKVGELSGQDLVDQLETIRDYTEHRKVCLIPNMSQSVYNRGFLVIHSMCKILIHHLKLMSDDALAVATLDIH